MIDVHVDFGYCNNLPVYLTVSYPGSSKSNYSWVPLDKIAHIEILNGYELNISLINNDLIQISDDRNGSKKFYLDGVGMEFYPFCMAIIEKVQSLKTWQCGIGCFNPVN